MVCLPLHVERRLHNLQTMWRWLLLLWVASSAAGQNDLAAGRKIFESQCALCHGQTGGGGRGPALNRPKLDKAPDDEALRKVISNGFDREMPGAWQLNSREVANVAGYVRSLGAIPSEAVKGDPGHGAEIFNAKGCATCHMVAGKGAGFGPELTDIGARRNAAWLRQTVRRPADSLPDSFQFVAATTSSGTTVRGIRVNEDSFTIQLKDTGGGFHSFRKSELKQLRRLPHETPMPSYERQLSAAELDDLVAYRSSLKGKL
jgi:cytochrome c oxidase cbb3-type subunit III